MHPFYEVKRSGSNHYITVFITNTLTFPPHLHSYVELIYVVGGRIKVSINEQTKYMKQGNMGISFPNDIHSYYSEEGDQSEIIVLIFSPEIISGFFRGLSNKSLLNPFFDLNTYNDNNESIVNLLYMLYEEYNNDKSEFTIKGLLYTIFGKLNSKFVLKEGVLTYHSAMQNLLVYLEGHYSENITLESVAKKLGYSKFYLSRLFSSKIGYQFNEYVNRLRINKAERLVKETDNKIFDIAMECGFESLRNFNRVFKKYTGVTPKEFRKS